MLSFFGKRGREGAQSVEVSKYKYLTTFPDINPDIAKFIRQFIEDEKKRLILINPEGPNALNAEDGIEVEEFDNAVHDEVFETEKEYYQALLARFLKEYSPKELIETYLAMSYQDFQDKTKLRQDFYEIRLPYGLTLPHLFAMMQNDEVMRILLESDISLDLVTESLDTLPHLFFWRTELDQQHISTDTAQLLLKKGFDFSFTNIAEATVLDNLLDSILESENDSTRQNLLDITLTIVRENQMSLMLQTISFTTFCEQLQVVSEKQYDFFISEYWKIFTQTTSSNIAPLTQSFTNLSLNGLDLEVPEGLKKEFQEEHQTNGQNTYDTNELVHRRILKIQQHLLLPSTQPGNPAPSKTPDFSRRSN